MIIMTDKLNALMKELKATTPDTFFHAAKVKNLTYKIINKTNEIGITDYSQEEIDYICKGALLHDIGKIYVRNFILTKEDGLSKDEKNIMREHTFKGRDAIKDELKEEEYDIVTNICMYHHDRIDGNGYHGEKNIPVYVQIVSLCDAFEALREDRIYRPRFSTEKSLEIIKSNGCGVFDEKLVDCLCKIVKGEE